MSLSKATLNPIRMRILQHLMLHPSATAKELVEVMDDVPRTTLYRHINTLEDATLIKVIQENKIRGTVEKVYAINTQANAYAEQSPSQVTMQFMLEIMTRFERYFAGDGANPQADMLFMRTATFNLTDDEYGRMIGEVGAVMAKYLELEKTPDRKLRQLSTISSPYTNK
ncbi:MAG: helix-turn-helix domain-containing protein [Cellulosilyticaceae bacterium]